MTRTEPQAGSNRYALGAASNYEACALRLDTMELSYTDLNLAAKWARYHAGRWRRRAGIAAFVIVAALGVGLPDANRDGRVDFADLGLAVRQVVATAPAMTLPVHLTK